MSFLFGLGGHGIGPPERRFRTLMATIAGVVLIGLLGLAVPQTAEAHAELQSSTPTNGAIVATMPAAIEATFTEHIEPSESALELYDSQGRQIDGTSLTASADSYSMTLQVPIGLPNGTYSVLWNNLSNDDGHTAEGYFTFTVGTSADVSAVVTVPTDSVGGGPPQLLKTASRWAALVGLAAFLATWPIWTIVIRPALAGVWQEGPAFTRRMRRYALIACILAILGSVFALLVQAMALSNGTYFDKWMNTVGQTRFGKLWVLRIGLIVLEGLILSACAWWFVRHRRLESAAAWIVVLTLPMPFSLMSHASAQPSGRAFAIAADITHLLFAGIWIGGIFILTIVLFPLLRKLNPHQRRQVLIVAIPRFSLLMIIAWAALGLTGFYAGWLQVGNLHALTTTPYGQSLIVKLVLLASALIIAAVNLLVIERKIARKISDAAADLWGKRLRWTVAAEFILILGMLGAVGQMTSQEPAREVLIERSKQISVSYSDAQPPSKLLLAPGIAGVNHFRLEVGGESLPNDTAALLRLSMPGNANLGIKEITLSRVAGNAFEYHGSDLGIVGDWQIMMILREPGKAQVEATAETAIGSTAPQVDVPGAPWRFKTTGGVTGLFLILVGIGSVAFAVFSGRGRLRKETGGLGLAALVLGIMLLLQARIDPILAVAAGDGAINPNDVAMVERGKGIYTTSCLTCHGADLRGDGPAGAGMQPPPADFSQPHTMVHSDEDLVYWIENGKQGTAMPAFGSKLSDQDVRDVLAFIKNQQQSMGKAATIPDPSSCTVKPRSIEEIEALVGTEAKPLSVPTSANSPGQPLSPASDSAVDTQTQSEIINASAEMVACTNAVDTLRRLALFSDDNLKAAFPQGVSPGFAQMATQTQQPLPKTKWTALLDVQNITTLSDGRISATVVVDDPSSHIHPAALPGGTPASTDVGAQKATVIFVKVNDRWLIDEIR
ncbi:MAG: copper resistance protein CopC [Thermomicrobiales bacterium]